MNAKMADFEFERFGFKSREGEFIYASYLLITFKRRNDCQLWTLRVVAAPPYSIGIGYRLSALWTQRR
jgi:hypothetical protein